MKLSISAASFIGCVREKNEDMVLVGDRFVRNEEVHTEVSLDESGRYIIAVADGMGGYSGGEVASSETLHSLQYFFSDVPSNMDEQSLKGALDSWLRNIISRIQSLSRTKPELADLGTTLVAFIYHNHNFYWINCGDSRVYRMNNGFLSQLSTDHSLNEEMGQERHSHVVTNCIGGGSGQGFIDFVCVTDNVHSGDRFMLCSDGLTDMLNDGIIESLLENGADAVALCHEAEERGGFDNVSVAVIEVQ